MVMPGYPNANFANERESTRITVFVIPNATLCHSEHSEESREERKEILRFALNDKLIVNCQWLIVMRGTRRIMYLENNHWQLISSMGLGRWADGAASRAKENQAVRSEASYLIFRPASVAKACEAHEALTFWLLLGQAKSNGKNALNNKRNE